MKAADVRYDIVQPAMNPCVPRDDVSRPVGTATQVVTSLSECSTR